MSQRAMSIDNISFLSPPMTSPICSNNGNSNNYREEERNKENTHINLAQSRSTQLHDSIENLSPKNDMQHGQEDNGEERIIPWRAHLRKTNSRLSLIG